MFEELLRRISMDVTALANMLRVLFVSVIWRGNLVSATLLSGSTTVTVRHGLGRAANGCLVVGASAAGAYTVDLVTAVDTVTVRATSAPGSDVSLVLWVF